MVRQVNGTPVRRSSQSRFWGTAMRTRGGLFCDGVCPIGSDAVPCEQHEWVVFSTASTGRSLMLQCVNCGSQGVVGPLGESEWNAAFVAASMPYRWGATSRVLVKEGPSSQLYVTQASGSICECYTRRGVPQPRNYERLPVEMLFPPLVLRPGDREEVLEMVDVVRNGNLCSFLFAYFLRYAETDGFSRQGDAVKEIANRLEAVDQMGMHCSPAVVARILTTISGS